MLAYTLRGLAAHRLRSAGMALAVFLGVALVSGTFILTDTINRSFDDIFEQANRGADVVVTPREIVRQEMEEPPPFEASVLERVREVSGVESAAGHVSALVRLVDDDGEQLGNGFAPNFVFSVQPEPFVAVTYSDGREPQRPGEAALDESTSERSGLGVGDRVGVAGDTSVARYRIVGINKLGDASTGGAASAALTLREAQRVTDRKGKFDQISIEAAQDVDPVALKRRVQRVLPKTLRAETASENAGREGDEIASDLSFLTIALLVLSGVIVVVAAFLIFNTFSITVAQRIREFGLLRTLGAKRSQVMGAVVGEAALIGGLGTAAGVPGGFGAATGLRAIMKAVGIDLPSTGNVFQPRTAIVAVCVGLGVALVAAITPALRATRVTPMAALLEAELPERKGRRRLITALAVLFALAGAALVGVGLFGGIESSGSAAGLTGGGTALVLLAVSLFSPRLVKPLASVAGRPIERLRGITGRLARENAMRKPGRTAVTAAALMIGVAMVVFVAVFAAGITSSVNGVIDRNFQGDVFVQNTDGFSPIPATIAPELQRTRGVGPLSSIRFGTAKVNGVRGTGGVSGIDPAGFTGVFALEWEEGTDSTIERLKPDQAVVDDAWAKSNDIEVGDTLRTLGPAGRRGRYEVVGRIKNNVGFLGNFVITQAQLRRDFDVTRDTFILADAAPGTDPEAMQKRVEALLKARYPSTEALNQRQLKEDQEAQLQPLLAMVYGLLFLAVLVSIFGIVNTLALSIHERTRELGMLRAIGMSRRQLKRMIRYESVITALIGAILGTVLGMIFAAVVSRPLADEGFSLTYPVGNLVAILVLAALAGVLAAILPARRAAKLEVLEAVAYE